MSVDSATKHKFVPEEAPLTLTDEPPRPLGVWPQFALWASLGVSLFGPIAGALVTFSAGSVHLGLLACAVGVIIGGLLLGGCAAIGSATGLPSMVTLRGLLGLHGSYVPTILNIAQNIGWATMEIIVIASAATGVAGNSWRWPFVIITGIVCTIMAIRPLGSVKVLRTILLWIVIASSIYLFISVLTQPSHAVDQSGVIGFMPAADLAIAQVVSFCPLVADYTRHSKSNSAAFTGSSLGFGLASFSYCALGVLAVGHLTGDLSGTHLIGALIALPAGAIAIIVLLTDEVDEAFANIYSTTVSVHNLIPNVDRRIVSVIVGLTATLLAGTLDFSNYQSFLYLIGSAFVPLAVVSVVDFFLVSKRHWDTSKNSSFRWGPTLAWISGFLAYQLIYPGDVPGWSAIWRDIAHTLHINAPSWLGSTLGTIVVAAIATIVFGEIEKICRKTSVKQTD